MNRVSKENARRAGILALLTSVSVFALPITPAGANAVQTLSFSDTSSVIDTPATTGATTGSHTYGSLNFNQFDTTTGVLTSVQVTLTSTRKETTVVTGTPPSGSQTKRNSASNGDSAYLAAPGITSATTGQPVNLSQSTSCGPNQSPACPVSLTSLNLATNSNFAVAAANRSLYVGLGTVNVTLNSMLSALNTTSGGTWTTPKDTYSVAWAGNVAVDYSYQQHSEASFNSSSTNYDNLTIDFGTVSKGSSPAQQSFELYNLLQTDPNAEARIGMDFDAAHSSASGDTSAFNFDTLFSSIFQQAAGNGTNFGVSFDTSKLGTFTAVYDLAFFDSAQAGSIGQSGNMAVLTITGTVVPEPQSLSLAFGGLMLMGGVFGLRRKRNGR